MRLSSLLPAAPPADTGDAPPDPGDGFGDLMASLDEPARTAPRPEASAEAPLRRWPSPLAAQPPARDAATRTPPPLGSCDLMANATGIAPVREGQGDGAELPQTAPTAAALLHPAPVNPARMDAAPLDAAPLAPPPTDPARLDPESTGAAAEDISPAIRALASAPAPAARAFDLNPIPRQPDARRAAAARPDDPRPAQASPQMGPARAARSSVWASAPAGGRAAPSTPETDLRKPPQAATEALPADVPAGALPGTWAMATVGLPLADRRTNGEPRPDPRGIAAGEAMTETAVEPRITVSVLNRETHFAPVRSFTQALAAADAAPQAGAGAQSSTREGDGAPAPAVEATAHEKVSAVEATAPENAAAAEATAPEIAPAGPSAPGPVALSVAPGPAPLAARIGAAVAGEAARLAPAAMAQERGATGGPVRVLELALSPETLGRVVVRLRLTPDGLSVRMRADNPETARLLEEDRPRLLQALAAAGAGPVEMEFADPFRPLPLAAAPPSPGRGSAGEDASGDERRRPSHQEQQDETPSQARRGRGDAAAG